MEEGEVWADGGVSTTVFQLQTLTIQECHSCSPLGKWLSTDALFTQWTIRQPLGSMLEDRLLHL